VYRRRRSLINPAREMLKTSTHNARVDLARAKRHSILFDDGEHPVCGLRYHATRCVAGRTHIFAQSESQQERILRARAIRHQLLFGNTIGGTSTQSGNSGLNLGASVKNVDEYDAGDLTYFTGESFDDLPTPPLTPVKRARILLSDSYGGSINYSLRLSRNTQDFEDITCRTKQLFEETSDLVTAPDYRSIGRLRYEECGPHFRLIPLLSLPFRIFVSKSSSPFHHHSII